MIANLDAVRSLAINIKSNTSDAFIQTQGRIVDSLINGKLATIFQEWLSIMNSGQYPAIVVDVANLMTAGRVEKTKYAVNDAGKSTPNPYGVTMYNDGLAMLDDLINARLPIIGLTRLAPTDSGAAEGTFDPVGGLRNQGGENRSSLDDMSAPYRVGSDTVGSQW